jgi:hypothetical protein
MMTRKSGSIRECRGRQWKHARSDSRIGMVFTSGPMPPNTPERPE